ncbi:hypothetical protein MWN34_17660 [Ancylobacter sp. 6x-1]|uniref:Uncharacterized protein n=1 Tax=Ancylobacter crimeensis TaxID=2579147 RepID=A0ABT0DFJ7_9HYPH|nr:hypothetical protein [Ancylobacter crimeensis]MCK0198728.1 hypothetical protein [Ancylobacter crimeensis]
MQNGNNDLADGYEADILDARKRSTCIESAFAHGVRDELRRINSSPAFDASERNRRFLRYVVEETLAGRGDRIKAYVIATSVFGRGMDFNPQIDPVVRMEAQRLRRALERFYLTEGRENGVRIALPKGGYVPDFQEAPRNVSDTAPAMAFAPSCDATLASIVVGPFAIEGDETRLHAHDLGLAYQLMIGLSRYPRLGVIDAGVGEWVRTWPTPRQGSDAGADLVLTGSRIVSDRTMEVKAVLLHAGPGRVLWGCSFQRSICPGGLLHARDALAHCIVQALPTPDELVERIGSYREQAAPAQDQENDHAVRGVASLSYIRDRSRLFPKIP